MLSFRVQEHEAREDKAREHWLLRNRHTTRGAPEELHISVLGTVEILHAIEIIVDNVGSLCT
jgi:hypothetical protein